MGILDIEVVENLPDAKLDDRMKDYEKETRNYINPEDYLIIRLDGNKFSKFTKGFNKPFDDILSKCMIEATKEIVSHFGAVTGYTQSDEITIVLSPSYERKLIPVENIFEANIAIEKETGDEFYIEDDFEDDELYPIYYFYIGDDDYSKQIKYGRVDSETGRLPVINSNLSEAFEKYEFFIEDINNNQIYNGRVDKIASIFASKATLIFNKVLFEEYNKLKASEASKSPLVKRDIDEYIEMLEGKLFTAIFDGRAFGVPSEVEVFNALLFRMRDAEKNSKSMFTQVHSSHKETLNMNGDEKVRYCLETTGKDWNELRGGYKYGFLIKKEAYEVKVDKEKFPKSQEDTAIRTRLVVIEEKFGFSDENVELITTKRIGG